MKNSNIKIISASAGSGKTYALAEELKKAIHERKVRPEAIIAMTFTKKAAAELKERVRGHLLSAGEFEAAQCLMAARIGTVDSVCAGLISDFAFELGLFPEMTVLDEEAAKRELRRTLSRIKTEDHLCRIADLASRMDDKWDIDKDILKVMSLARSNGIGPDLLQDFKEKSKESYKDLLGEEEASGCELDQCLLEALNKFLDETAQGRDNAIRRNAARCLTRLQNKQSLRWRDWVKLTSDKGVANYIQQAYEPVQDAAKKHDNHPKLHEDVNAVIDLVFELAEKSLSQYKESKAQQGLLDFTDQEVYTYELLSKKQIRDILKKQIDLVLVDEFQDTSPIQLAIFLRLSEVAPNIWVGDQKQCVFGFRDADPVLMDSLIDKICEDSEPETLSTSYRSRPALVSLTSDLFAPAFQARQSMPEKRTRLEPESQSEPGGLGPVIEYWKLTKAKRERTPVNALAASIRALLSDPSVKVRCSNNKGVRNITAGDIAVLCRTNSTRLRVADSLENIQIRTSTECSGLKKTLEVRVLLAALKLWIDSRDALSIAELSRIIHFPDKGDEWLKNIIEKSKKEGNDFEVVKKILKAKDNNLHESLVDIVNCLISCTDIIHLCHRWGDTNQRLANIETFKHHVRKFSDQCLTEAIACTPLSFLDYFEKLGDEDYQGIPKDQEAVTISTVHKSKGLEWPVVILFNISPDEARLLKAPLGGRMIGNNTQMDISNPLDGRQLLYWPDPYHWKNTNVPLVERLGENPIGQIVKESELREQLRVLYVGWTRAKDILVLAGDGQHIEEGVYQQLNNGSGRNIYDPTDEEKNVVKWAGREIKIEHRDKEPVDTEKLQKENEPEIYFEYGQLTDYPPKYVSPSLTKKLGNIGKLERLGERVQLQGGTELWNCVGNAVHAFLAADHPGLKEEIRLDIANRLLSGWGANTVLTPESLLGTSNRLKKWANAKWPSAKWLHEWPVCYKDEDGSVVRGQIDLLLETDEGFVVIDHKSFPGSEQDALTRTKEYAGQINYYLEALRRSGRKLADSYVHLPLLGLVISVV